MVKEGNYKCPSCSAYAGPSSESLRSHIHNHHPDQWVPRGPQEEVACPQCSRTMARRLLALHLAIPDKNRTFVCTLCSDYAGESQPALVTHVRYQHPETWPAKSPCSVCDCLNHPNDLGLHALTHQVQGRPFVCVLSHDSYCGCKPMQLYDHIRHQHPAVMCTNQVFLCPVCQASLTISQLATHVCAH